MRSSISAVDLRDDLTAARGKTNALWLSLTEEQMTLPVLSIVNPVLWEVGHVAWFQEYWVLRHLAGKAALLPRCDELYDSAKVEHRTRWSLPLPDRQRTSDYMQATLDRVLESSEKAADPYFFLLALFHEDMHAEAMTYTRQTIGLPAPEFPAERAMAIASRPIADLSIPGGEALIGASPDQPFLFDNEKWAHPVVVKDFDISSAPASNRDFLAFVEAGGYQERRYWTDEGWAWRVAAEAHHPVYWRRKALRDWELRLFDRWLALELDGPAVHVNAHEAEAYCRWAGRRLPTEFEWEAWARRLNDPPFGMPNAGAVWEWTASRFLPYSGFKADPYKEYSEPWFTTPHRVLRGGSWVTPSRLMRPSFRNFYEPHRRDIYAGFRTCSVSIS